MLKVLEKLYIINKKGENHEKFICSNWFVILSTVLTFIVFLLTLLIKKSYSENNK